MSRQKRIWHSRFKKYMKFIVKHKNYKGMPEPYKESGSIRWVVTGNSRLGKQREGWWDSKRKKLGIKKIPGWKAIVARKIHPIGKKPCQICGKVLSLDYVYPNKGCPYRKNPIIPCKKDRCRIFKTKGKCPHLGPGAMGDAPDRLDGFHTYNRCCRSKQDTGRHPDNLRKYGEDRRVYEFWAEGDWKTASWLMKLFNKHHISPDHIGPISLGFCHRPKFRPITETENIAKGNRMTFEDVQDLILDEKRGEQVVSRHSSFIWDKLKNKVSNDAEAEILSKLMRENLHKILIIFSILHLGRFDDFLINNFLHPEYALFQPIFKNFDPRTGICSEIIKKRANRTEQIRNKKRYIRKSLEALERYQLKDNRRIVTKLGNNVSKNIEELKKILSQKEKENAKKFLERIFELMAEDALREFLSTK